MKTLILNALLLMISLTTIKSQNNQDTDNQKFIEVTGKAELEFIADQFKYSITILNDYDEGIIANNTKKLKEYQERINKEAEQKYSKIWEILKSEGIDESLIVTDEKYNFISKKSTDLSNKTFVIKIVGFEKFQQIVAKLKKSNLCNGQIIEAKSLNIAELEDKTKILAIEDAKKQAEKLALAVNSKLGKILQVKEPKQPFEDLLGNNAAKQGWTAYPPLTLAMQDTFFVMGNVEISDNGKFVLKQAITVRFSLEN